MITESKVTEIFVMAEELSKFFTKWWKNIPYQTKISVNTIVMEQCRKLKWWWHWFCSTVLAIVAWSTSTWIIYLLICVISSWGGTLQQIQFPHAISHNIMIIPIWVLPIAYDKSLLNL